MNKPSRDRSARLVRSILDNTPRAVVTGAHTIAHTPKSAPEMSMFTGISNPPVVTESSAPVSSSW
jgi:hypothetical protein